MTTFEWFSIIQSVVMTGALVLIWLLRRSFQSGSWSTDLVARLAVLERSHDAHTERLNHTGAKLSDLASTVQGLPERLREHFLPLDRANDWNAESRTDRVRIWQAIDQLRTKP